jgi:hypothetical protein
MMVLVVLVFVRSMIHATANPGKGVSEKTA